MAKVAEGMEETVAKIVTITEMGEKVYLVCVQRGEQRRTMRLTRGLHDAIQRRGQQVWRTRDFGWGRIGQQAQYKVED